MSATRTHIPHAGGFFQGTPGDLANGCGTQDRKLLKKNPSVL